MDYEDFDIELDGERDKDFGYELLRRVTQVVIRRLQATRARLATQAVQAA